MYASVARKERATSQNMKITYYKEESEEKYQVGVLGSRRLPYILNFCENSISCSCPDFCTRTQKHICKHIYFIIHLAKNNLIFNTVNELSELIHREKVRTIRENLLSVIDKKKMETNSSESNTISIERDDCCSICMEPLSENIKKCMKCEHVIHHQCLTDWWDLNRRLTHQHDVSNGKCPYCRANNGFAYIFQALEDPWEGFNFQTMTEALLDPNPSPTQKEELALKEELASAESTIDLPEPEILDQE